MKKFLMRCGLTALILILAGLLLTVIAGSVRGSMAIEEVVDSVTDGKVRVKLSEWEDFGITIGDDFFDDLGEKMNSDVQYELEDSMMFDNTFEIFQGDIAKYSVGSDILELNIEVGGCELKVEESGDNNFYLEAENTKKFQGYVKDGVLYVKGTVNTGVINDLTACEITLYVPQNVHFDKVNAQLGAGNMEWKDLNVNEAFFEVGAGQITLSSIQADTLELTVGMGEILAEEMQVKELDAEVDMGHFFAEGSISEGASVECNMGSLEMKVDGKWEDFNYDLDCGMGNLQLGENTYSGISNEKEIDNQADKEMEIKCAMGNIEIEFTE